MSFFQKFSSEMVGTHTTPIIVGRGAVAQTFLRYAAPDIKLYHSPYSYFDFTLILLYMKKGNGRV